MTETEGPNKRTSQEKWDAQHPEIIKASKAKYDQQYPVWSFRPTPELLQWLEEKRGDDEHGNPETNSALLIRKLEKLRRLENQGY